MARHNNVPIIMPTVNITKAIKIEQVLKKPAKIQKPFNASRTYLTAKIKFVSPFGLILIKFSETMQKVLTNNISEIFN